MKRAVSEAGLVATVAPLSIFAAVSLPTGRATVLRLANDEIVQDFGRAIEKIRDLVRKFIVAVPIADECPTRRVVST